jgi:hypothetical protein
MTSDPGDIVLDPTCGSGTTAYVAEQWGRRWITIDTSRVALALARSRVMGARYAYYLLADSCDGQRKEAEIMRTAPKDVPTFGDLRQGFFAQAAPGSHPKPDEDLYFEIPAGIEQIESLKTEVHLFLFDILPPDPRVSLANTASATAKFTCTTLGAENQQGNLEVKAEWRIDKAPQPVLKAVPSGSYRPATPAGLQQVRAKVRQQDVAAYEYSFEREQTGWDPELSEDDVIRPTASVNDLFGQGDTREAQIFKQKWKLDRGLSSRLSPANERDQLALSLAAPESGAFILVSLRRRAIHQSD